eukprot:2782822-Rhodomonas_salina.1
MVRGVGGVAEDSSWRTARGHHHCALPPAQLRLHVRLLTPHPSLHPPRDLPTSRPAERLSFRSTLSASRDQPRTHEPAPSFPPPLHRRGLRRYAGHALPRNMELCAPMLCAGWSLALRAEGRVVETLCALRLRAEGIAAGELWFRCSVMGMSLKHSLCVLLRHSARRALGGG